MVEILVVGPMPSLFVVDMILNSYLQVTSIPVTATEMSPGILLVAKSLLQLQAEKRLLAIADMYMCVVGGSSPLPTNA